MVVYVGILVVIGVYIGLEVSWAVVVVKVDVGTIGVVAV